MKIYLVGGAVRDRLLGLPVKDRDYVVVGATSEDMLALGYTPVGKDFPVFLHPSSREQYALARTERKTAPGYHGFLFHADPAVTLEQDLARRDLTINALAESADGSVTDPFGGLADLKARLFRHVSPAFVEDPVRILRVARFASRFSEFSIAPETAALMTEMVLAGEVDALVSERVWQEFSRGLMADRPSRMLSVLRECGAFSSLCAELSACWTSSFSGSAGTQALERGEQISNVLDAAARAGASLAERVAILMQIVRSDRHDHQPAETLAIKAACATLKMPRECQELAIMVGREYAVLSTPTLLLDGELAIGLLERCDAFRKPERFLSMLKVLTIMIAAGADACHEFDAAVLSQWRAILAAAQQVDGGAIAALINEEHSPQPLKIQQALRTARIEKIKIVTNITIANS
jgi:tRNA nucleotidyltransferase (CCA-adding enzyme)